jgi:hypothetical protein
MNKIVLLFAKQLLRGALLSSVLALAACDTKSSVDFLGKRNELKGTILPTAFLGSAQGGIVNGQTAGGYKVQATLGASTSKISGTTASGHKVQLGFVGQSSLSK